MTDVFVVGAFHLDVVVDAPRLPGLDETLMGDSVAYRFGGKGGNQAVAAARMGARVAMAGRIGQDSFGATVLETLHASGVDHTQVRQVPGATGMSVAIVDHNGEYGAVVVSGVNQTIDPREIDPQGAKIMLLQNEIPEAVNLAVVQSKAPGTQVILNAAPARACSEALLQAVDILIVNRVEAAQLTGQTNPDPNLEAAAMSLSALGPRTVVVTAGGDGAVVVDGTAIHQIAPPLRASGSAHGAGDAFVGALAQNLAHGSDLTSAVDFASGAAALFVQTPPSERQSIRRSDVERWRASLSTL